MHNIQVASKRAGHHVRELMTFLTETYLKKDVRFSFVHDSITVEASPDLVQDINLQVEAFEAGFIAGITST